MNAPGQPGRWAPPRAGGWRGIANRMRSATQRHQASVLAGGVAFFAFLSMLPALAALVSVYGLLAGSRGRRAPGRGLGRRAAPDIRRAIHDQMAELAARSPGTLSLEAAIGIMAAIWAATKGMKALVTGLSLAFGQPETRGFIRLNVTAFLFTMGAIVSGVGRHRGGDRPARGPFVLPAVAARGAADPLAALANAGGDGPLRA